MGAWIEIPEERRNLEKKIVAPLVGAWIEIFFSGSGCVTVTSLLSWERGLKY